MAERPRVLLMLGAAFLALATPTNPGDDTVRRQIESAYVAMLTAVKNKDVQAYMTHIAPDFTAVGQYGNVFDRRKLEAYTIANFSSKPLSETNDIITISVSRDAALVIVRHRLALRLNDRTVNGRKLAPKASHLVLIDEIMRQIWSKIGGDWKLTHWDDMSGNIRVDGKVFERWSPDKLARPRQ